MSEKAARQTFLTHVKKIFPGVHLQRIEDRFHAGIPDMNLCFPDSGEWWVEAKHVKGLPKWARTPVHVEIRREQVLWLNNRKRAGGKCLVLVRIGLEEWVVFDDHFEKLEEGVPMEAFFRMAKWRGDQLDVAAIFS